jgi:hypothetical protein
MNPWLTTLFGWNKFKTGIFWTTILYIPTRRNIQRAIFALARVLSRVVIDYPIEMICTLHHSFLKIGAIPIDGHLPNSRGSTRQSFPHFPHGAIECHTNQSRLLIIIFEIIMLARSAATSLSVPRRII